MAHTNVPQDGMLCSQHTPAHDSTEQKYLINFDLDFFQLSFCVSEASHPRVVQKDEP